MTGLPLYAAIFIAGGVLLGMVVLLARQSGKASAERDIAQDKASQGQEANAIDETVSRMSDADLDRELRGR